MCNKNYRVDKLHPFLEEFLFLFHYYLLIIILYIYIYIFFFFLEKHSDDIHLNKKEPLGLTLIIANKCSGLIFSSFMNKSLEVHVILIYY